MLFNENPRNANVILIISCQMISPTFGSKISKLINQSHEFYNTVIVYIIWPWNIRNIFKHSNRTYKTWPLCLKMILNYLYNTEYSHFFNLQRNCLRNHKFKLFRPRAKLKVRKCFCSHWMIDGILCHHMLFQHPAWTHLNQLSTHIGFN